MADAAMKRAGSPACPCPADPPALFCASDTTAQPTPTPDQPSSRHLPTPSPDREVSPNLSPLLRAAEEEDPDMPGSIRERSIQTAGPLKAKIQIATEQDYQHLLSNLASNSQQLQRVFSQQDFVLDGQNHELWNAGLTVAIRYSKEEVLNAGQPEQQGCSIVLKETIFFGADEGKPYFEVREKEEETTLDNQEIKQILLGAYVPRNSHSSIITDVVAKYPVEKGIRCIGSFKNFRHVFVWDGVLIEVDRCTFPHGEGFFCRFNVDEAIIMKVLTYLQTTGISYCINITSKTALFFAGLEEIAQHSPNAAAGALHVPLNRWTFPPDNLFSTSSPIPTSAYPAHQNPHPQPLEPRPVTTMPGVYNMNLASNMPAMVPVVTMGGSGNLQGQMQLARQQTMGMGMGMGMRMGGPVPVLSVPNISTLAQSQSQDSTGAGVYRGGSGGSGIPRFPNGDLTVPWPARSTGGSSAGRSPSQEVVSPVGSNPLSASPPPSSERSGKRESSTSTATGKVKGAKKGDGAGGPMRTNERVESDNGGKGDSDDDGEGGDKQKKRNREASARYRRKKQEESNKLQMRVNEQERTIQGLRERIKQLEGENSALKMRMGVVAASKAE